MSDNNGNSQRDFLRRLLSASALVAGGLFFGSKESLAHDEAVASGKCGSSYSCSGA